MANQDPQETPQALREGRVALVNISWPLQGNLGHITLPPPSYVEDGVWVQPEFRVAVADLWSHLPLPPFPDAQPYRVWVDMPRRLVQVMVTSMDLPVCPDGMMPPAITPVYAIDWDDAGHGTTRFSHWDLHEVLEATRGGAHG